MFEFNMQEMLGEDYIKYISSFDHAHYQGLRVNTTKVSVEEFKKISPFLLKQVPWCENGFYYEPKEKPAKHPFYHAGLYYIQEPSAMVSAAFLPVEPGEKVLDLCAAPGGKSTQLAAKLFGKGLLVSNDISYSRTRALLKNIELFGIGNSVVVSEPPQVLAARFPNYFDKILIDAPCSGEGMFRKQFNMIQAWEKNGIELFVALQRSILTEAVKMLKPGGKLIYSTCTFSKEENEHAIEYLLNLNQNLSLVELPLLNGFDTGHPDWGITENMELKKTRRLWPHHIEGEGHFVAMVEKKGAINEEDVTPPSAYQYHNQMPSTFLKEFLGNIQYTFKPEQIECVGEKVYYIPDDMPDVKGLRLLRCGLYLGNMRKNRFEPSGSLAMFLNAKNFDNVISFELSDDRVVRYLKGETIETEAKSGYVLVCVSGYPLGFAKSNNGVLKNKYPAGWRFT